MIVKLVSVQILLFLVAELFNEGQAQMVKQCLCSQTEPCAQKYFGALEPCIESCQHHLQALGGNFAALKQCFKQKQSLISSAIQCTQGQNKNACAQSGGEMVPKRYPETMQIAAFAEINKMINSMGLGNEAKGFMAVGKKMFGCVRTCMAKKSGNCDKKMACGLKLPPDNVLVQSAKQCAISSGLNTENVRGLCQCSAGAGVKGLGSVCSKIKIT
uniref:Uncharacterized protein n=2 Tax=Meloidogyne TaxID=189290 RepID=A0A6V7V1D3_MELEN|nr:unnamed protein product [Meloidogyne enterolobii]CAD2168702.1 unnamed protein product [Meloidogyne enterolobii]